MLSLVDVWRDSPGRILFRDQIRPADWLLGARSTPFVPPQASTVWHALLVWLFTGSTYWVSNQIFQVWLLPEISMKLLDLTSLTRVNHLWELRAVCSREIFLTSIWSIDPRAHICIFLLLWFVPLFALFAQSQLLSGEFDIRIFIRRFLPLCGTQLMTKLIIFVPYTYYLDDNYCLIVTKNNVFSIPSCRLDQISDKYVVLWTP